MTGPKSLARYGRLGFLVRSGCISIRQATQRIECRESLNSRIRDEYLSITSFWSLAQLRVVVEEKYDDNHRRGSALGYPSPARLRRQPYPSSDSGWWSTGSRARSSRSSSSHDATPSPT
jgi:hypothetical protein